MEENEKEGQRREAGNPFRIPRNMGDLDPVEQARAEIQNTLATLRKMRETEEDDHYQVALAFALRTLDDALRRAKAAKLLLTPAQMAEIQEVTVAALYKRIRRAEARGKTIPGLRREGRSIYFEVDLEAA